MRLGKVFFWAFRTSSWEAPPSWATNPAWKECPGRLRRPDVFPPPATVGVHLLGRCEPAHDVIVRHIGEQARLVELSYQPCGHHRRDEVDELASQHGDIRMDMLVIAEALLDEPPLVVHLVDDQGVGVQVGVKHDGAEPLVALLQGRGVDGLALVVPEVVGLFFYRPLAVIERLQPAVRNLFGVDDIFIACRDLKKVYPASAEEEALLSLEDFGGSWNSKYPMIQKSWETHWGDLVEFFRYPEKTRKIICTTNAIESLNFPLRKVTKTGRYSLTTTRSARLCILQ